MNIRIGHGYDVHRLDDGRKLILGGVEIPHKLGLLGHSDADVLLHAVIDAILGAAALGDIGGMFPDSDPEYDGISSIYMLGRVMGRICSLGLKVGNIDCTIIAQNPILAPHMPKMRYNLAAALGIPEGMVNIKATTEERLGFTGAELGIAAHAVVILIDN